VSGRDDRSGALTTGAVAAGGTFARAGGSVSVPDPALQAVNAATAATPRSGRTDERRMNDWIGNLRLDFISADSWRFTAASPQGHPQLGPMVELEQSDGVPGARSALEPVWPSARVEVAREAAPGRLYVALGAKGRFAGIAAAPVDLARIAFAVGAGVRGR